MLTVYGSHHVPSNRLRRGSRAVRSQTGFFSGEGEARRVFHEQEMLAARRERMNRLVRQWKAIDAFNISIRRESCI